MVDEMSGAIQYTSRIGSRLGAPLRVMREPPASQEQLEGGHGRGGQQQHNSSMLSCVSPHRHPLQQV